MKKFIITIACILLLSSTILYGCGNASMESPASDEEIPTEEISKTTQEEVSSEDKGIITDAAKIDIEETADTVIITSPASLEGDSTDEAIAEWSKEDGYISITKNDDGSVTYVLTKAKQKEILEKVENDFPAYAAMAIEDTSCPNITDLTANSNFTEFTFTTTAASEGELTYTERAYAGALYSFGEVYQTYNGVSDPYVIVNYVNQETGEKICTGNSLTK